MVVAAIAAVLVGIAIPVTDQFIRTMRADSSVSAATDGDRHGTRPRSQRTPQLRPDVRHPNRIRLSRQEINAAGVVTARHSSKSFILEGGQTFLKFTGIPDTPDAFGAVGRHEVHRHRAGHVHE